MPVARVPEASGSKVQAREAMWPATSHGSGATGPAWAFTVPPWAGSLEQPHGNAPKLRRMGEESSTLTCADSFTRLLGGLRCAIEKVHNARPQTVLGSDDQ